MIGRLQIHTKKFTTTSANAAVPFLAYVAPHAPHARTKPAPRDRHTQDGLKAPRPPSRKRESPTSPWIRQLPRLSDAKKTRIDSLHEKRAESLQAVDDLVAGVLGKLRD